MKYKFITNIIILIMIIGCDSMEEKTFYPGLGIGNIVIGKHPPNNAPKNLIIFQDESGKVDLIYTESSIFKLELPNFNIEINDKFSDLDQSLKESLVRDPTSRDLFGSDWFVSKLGFMISVDDNIINGIGVIPKN
jgi:hypothetical protein